MAEFHGKIDPLRSGIDRVSAAEVPIKDCLGPDEVAAAKMDTFEDAHATGGAGSTSSSAVLSAPRTRAEFLERPNLIVGGGPSGLYAALKLAMEGEPATVLELRDSYTRVQRIQIPGDLKMSFKRYVDLIPAGKEREKADGILEKLETEGSIQIKDIETLLHLVIENGENEGVSLREFVNIKFGSKLLRVDDDKMVAYFQQADGVHALPFSNVMVATGHRDVTHLFDSRQETGPIGRVESAVQPDHTSYFTLALELPRGVDLPAMNMPEREAFLEGAQKLGWNLERLPVFNFLRNKGKDKEGAIVKISLAGEAPPNMLSLPLRAEAEGGPCREDALFEWGKMLVSSHYSDLDESLLRFRYAEEGSEDAQADEKRMARRAQKKGLTATAWEYHLSEMERPAFNMGKGILQSTVFFVGDANFTPWSGNTEGLGFAFLGGDEAAWAIHNAHKNTHPNVDIGSFLGMSKVKRQESRGRLKRTIARRSKF